MKAMSKGKILKKLNTIKAIGYLKPDKILQANGYFGNFPLKLNSNALTSLAPFRDESKKSIDRNVEDQEPEIIQAKVVMIDPEDQDMESDREVGDKENIKPREDDTNSNLLKGSFEEIRVTEKKIEYLDVKVLQSDGSKERQLPDIDSSNFRRPVLDSGCLFDPNLLAAFEQAVIEARAREDERMALIDEVIMKDMSDEPAVKSSAEEYVNPLLDFEEHCPPGGSDCVIFYTTSLRGIRQTFEECHSVRFLLESFRVLFYERDISMHSEYKEELWRVLDGKVLPPKLFIKGRYIGGAEKILTLNEQGKFRPLFVGIPVDETRGHCDSCNGVRFLMCFNCSGSRKIVCEEDGEEIRCPKCNENGVIVCPLCS